MQTHELILNGKTVSTHLIELPGAPLLVARGAKGFVMCGYLDIAAADKFNTAAAVVRGVKTIDELLAKPVAAVSRAAEELGVQPGMTGREALERFA